MKPGYFFSYRLIGLTLGIATLLSVALPYASHGNVPVAPAIENQPSPAELDPIGKAVVELLQSKDAGVFATNVAVSAADVRSLETTNLSAEDIDGLKNFEKGATYNVTRLKGSAKAFLDRADSLHLDFSKGSIPFEIISPKTVGKMYWTHPTPDGTGGTPYIDKLKIILRPDSIVVPPGAGDFELAIDGVEKLPAGWRIGNGLQWTTFPTNYIDAKTQRELAVMEKISNYKGFTGEDDPALLEVGNSLIRFVRGHDVARYEKELLLNGELVWDMFQKNGRKGPSRQEIDDEIRQQNHSQLDKAAAVTKVMDDAGVDLRNAEIIITSASVDRGQALQQGSLDQAMAEQFQLAFSVKTDARAKSGASISGDYVLGVRRLQRFSDTWKIVDDLHWVKLPPGILDAKSVETMEFENYVAEHGTLPLQSAAPEVEFTTLADGKKMKLSDFKGKVVIMDFWATWCGPCQGPMAELQKLREGHGNWGDKVAIIPLSIDDDIDTVRKHVEKRGWTNTFNVWAGPGGWRAVPPQTYRVTGVPTSYVINQKGQIVWAGHPAGANFSEKISSLLAN